MGGVSLHRDQAGKWCVLHCRAAFLLAALIGRTVAWVLLGALYGHLKRDRFQGALRVVLSAKGQ